MDPANINTYGGIFEDEFIVEKPTTQLSSSYDNRLHSDAAQMTRTSVKAWATFTPTATAGPTTLDATTITARSWWGAGGSPQKPVIVKTATGRYTCTWPTPLSDELNVPEDVSFLPGWAVVNGSTNGSARIDSIAANVVTLRVYDAAGSLADLTTDTVTVFLL